MATLEIFLTLATQWRLAPDGRPQGLDYAAIAPACALIGRAATSETFADLRVMEMAALDVFRAAAGGEGR